MEQFNLELKKIIGKKMQVAQANKDYTGIYNVIVHVILLLCLCMLDVGGLKCAGVLRSYKSSGESDHNTGEEYQG